MKAVVQRVSEARVVVEGQIVGACDSGLLVLVSAHRDDTELEAGKMAQRIVKLRIFNDKQGKMNLSLTDVQGSVLAVPNFTVYGETAKNRRPSFTDAAPYEQGQVLFERLVTELRALRCRVQTGTFGAHMSVSLCNDGPVTVILEVPPNRKHSLSE